MKNINEIPIVLHTIDSYSKYWDDWYYFFKKYVRNHGPIFFLSEEKEPSFVNEINHIKTGSGEWGYRLLEGLKQIDSELIIYSQEDFWGHTELKLENNLIEMFYKHNMDHFTIKELTPLTQQSKVEGEFELYKLEQNSNYTHHHQFALWKKSKLISNVFPDENPWENEINGSHRLNKGPHNVYILNKSWYVTVCGKGKLMERGIDLLKGHDKPYEKYKT